MEVRDDAQECCGGALGQVRRQTVEILQPTQKENMSGLIREFETAATLHSGGRADLEQLGNVRTSNSRGSLPIQTRTRILFLSNPSAKARLELQNILSECLEAEL